MPSQEKQSWAQHTRSAEAQHCAFARVVALTIYLLAICNLPVIPFTG